MKAEFIYKCGYCGKEFTKIRNADLSDCMIKCEKCGNFLKKKKFTKMQRIGKYETNSSTNTSISLSSSTGKSQPVL